VSFEDDLKEAESRARAAVFHHYSVRAGKTKYLVVLNHTWPPHDGLVVYAFTTTNVNHFAAAHVPENTIVRLSPGDYPFVTASTVIDLTRPEVEQLSAIVSARSFKFVVQLRAEHVKSIDDAVLASTVIVRKVKKMILASYG
jgi:mRNA-degrading endonuclease toxin of MazEF toxin-antitoxin module